MGHLADRLDSMLVTATTPDGTTFIELRGRTDVRISFAPGYYRHATESRLAGKLQAAARLLWVARTKEYFRAYAEATGRDASGEHIDTDNAQAFKDARMEIVARGESDDGVVTVVAAALWDWTISIAPGTVRAVDEQEFCRLAGQAGTRQIEDQYRQLRDVRRQLAEAGR